MKEQIKNLLQRVSVINENYKKIAEITGENFNIFKVLNLQTDEVRLHSAFIAELLNPKGSHGQKDVFLKLFIEELGLDEGRASKFETVSALAKKEKNVGEINLEKTEGGRIDIVISSGKRNIFIENKIYARDQPNQLLRYYNADKKADLLYLTLDGKEASDESTGGKLKAENESTEKETKYYKVISYQEDIVTWLEKCIKETVNFPLLRETISQYINTIKQLTGQSINKQMENEIIELLTKSENTEAAILIKNIIQDFPISLAKRIEDKYKGNCEPFDKIWRYKRRDTVFEAFNFKKMSLKLDVWCDINGYHAHFWLPGSSKKNVKEIFKEITVLSDFQAFNDESNNVKKHFKIVEEVELFKFIDKLLKELKEMKKIDK